MCKLFKILTLMVLALAWSGVHAQATGTVTYLYTDPQGTILAKADAAGTITATFDYTPYGSAAIGTPPNGPGYTGHVNDPETNFVYMKARYYDPATGRFLSVDPNSPVPADGFSFNRYAYTDNNPITHIDPNGKSVSCDGDSCTIDAHSLLEVAIDYTYVGAVYIQRAIQGTIHQTAPRSTPQTQPNVQRGHQSTSADAPSEGTKESQRPTKTPNEGEPGSTHRNPGSGQVREYGEDGKPLKDIDYDHHHGIGIPHVHDWGRDANGNPVRGPGRAPNPETEPNIGPQNPPPPPEQPSST